MTSFRLKLLAVLRGATNQNDIYMEKIVFIPFQPTEDTVLQLDARALHDGDTDETLNYPLTDVVYSVADSDFVDTREETSAMELYTTDEPEEAKVEHARLLQMFHKFGFVAPDTVTLGGAASCTSAAQGETA